MNGTRGASVEEVAKFARAVGVSPAWLAYGEEAALLNDMAKLPEGWREYLRQKTKHMREALEAQHPLVLRALQGSAPEEADLNLFRVSGLGCV